MTIENDLLIRTKNLTKVYNQKLGSNLKALDGINLDVFSGEMLSIIGRSGSGKSTLLNIIGTLDTPTSGEIFLEGKNLKKYSDNELSLLRRHKIGFIFQTFNLIPILTVSENIGLSLYHHEISKIKKEEKVNEMLKFFEIFDKKSSLPHELSVGQQQKVAIARALVKNPLIIIADEPTGEMDPIAGSEIAKKFVDLKKEFKVTTIIASHGSFPYQKADRKIFLQDGKLVTKKDAGY